MKMKKESTETASIDPKFYPAIDSGVNHARLVTASLLA